MYQKREFTGAAKPAMFPIVFTPNPERKWDTNDSAKPFGQKLSDNIDLDSASDAELRSFFSAAATIQMASMQGGMGHMSIYNLALMEFSGDKSNQERVYEDDHVDYRRLLSSSIKGLNPASVQGDNDEDFEAEEQEDFHGLTTAHNLNLYGGVSSANPFKKQSDEYKAFEDNKLFQSLLSGQFMSPLHKLGQKFWDESKNVLERLQRRLPALKGVLDPYHDNHREGITEVDIHANYSDLLKDKPMWSSFKNSEFFGLMMKRWQDVKNTTKTTRIFAGRPADRLDEIRRAERKAALLADDPTVFSDYASEVEEALAELQAIGSAEQTGDAGAAGTLGDEFSSAEARADLDELLAMFDETDALSDELAAFVEEGVDAANIFSNPTAVDTAAREAARDISIAGTEHWFNQVGNNLPFVGMILPFGALADVAAPMFQEMELGNWENSLDSDNAEYVTDEAGGFMDLAMRGYFGHIQDNYLDGFTASRVVQADDFTIDNDEYGNAVFQNLVQVGAIDQNGNLSNSFDPDAEISIADSPAENARIRTILRQAVLGPFDFESVDFTRVNDLRREDMKITTPEGQNKSIKELVDLIGTGDTPQEIYGNSRQSYNMLFDMYESMTANHLQNGPQSGKPVIQEVDGKYQMEVYPKGTWKEWNPKQSVQIDANGREVHVGGFDVKEDQPVTIQFETKGKAEAFFSKVEELILILEPAMGSFEPTADVGPGRYGLSYQNGVPTEMGIRVLTDNQGEVGRNGIVTRGSSDYTVQIDTVMHHSFFQTQHWSDVSKNLQQETVKRVGKRMFEKSTMTRMNKLRWKRRKENYKELKKEHNENEYWRIRDQVRRDSKNRSTRKRLDKEYDAKVKKRLAEVKAAEKRSQQRLKKLLEKSKAKRASSTKRR